jgi:hypothetical protein
MESDNLSIEEVRRLAAAAGLDRFTDEHMQQLTRAANVAHARRKALQFAALGPADEPAHVFRPSAGDQP